MGRRVFMSYSRLDAEVATQIAVALERAGHDVWVDTADIQAGDRWRAQIVAGVEQADVVVLLISRPSVTSEHVITEVQIAKDYRKRILPLSLDGAKPTGELLYSVSGLQVIDLAPDLSAGIAALLASLDSARPKPLPPPPPTSAIPRWAKWVAGVVGGTLAVLLTLMLTDGGDEKPEALQPPSGTTQPPLDTTQPPLDTTQPPLDTTRPTVESILTEPTEPLSSETFELTATATDDVELATLELLFNAASISVCEHTMECTSQIGPMASGTYLFEAIARDAVGNAASRSMDVVVRKAMPDLVVISFELLGPVVPSDGNTASFRLVVRNQGEADAGPFQYTAADRFQRSMIVEGTAGDSQTIEGLTAGESMTIEGSIQYPSSASVGLDSFDVSIELDSCVGRAGAPPACDVLERDETNNSSPAITVDFFPVAIIASPEPEENLSFQSESNIMVDLDATSSFDPGGDELTYSWSVADSTGAFLSDLGTEPRATRSFRGELSCEGIFTFVFTLTVTDASGLMASTEVEARAIVIC